MSEVSGEAVWMDSEMTASQRKMKDPLNFNDKCFCPFMPGLSEVSPLVSCSY